MKNFLKIKILFITFTYPIPTDWAALTHYQVIRLLSILEEKTTRPLLVRISIILLMPKKSYFRKLILFLFLSPEALTQMLQHAQKFTQEITLAPDQIQTIGKKYHCPNMQKITFGQFIDADMYYQKNKIEHILAVLYTPPNPNRQTETHAKQILALPMLIRYAAYIQFVTFHKSIIEHLNAIASRYPGDSSVLAPDFSWQDVIFSLSETALNIKDYSQLPLVEAIAEIEYKAKTAHYARKNMERQAQNR